MRTLAIAAALVHLLLLVPGVALADDKDDVIAALMDYIAGYHEGDGSRIAGRLTEDATAFVQGLGLISQPFNAAGFQAGVENGNRFNFGFRNIDVQIYGGDTAILTAYEVGSINLANGNTQQGPWRYTTVGVKQDGRWLQAHRHASPLRTGALGQ